MHTEFSHEMEDGLCDDPDSGSYGRAFIAFLLDRFLGLNRTYFSGKEVLLPFNSDNWKGSALFPANGDQSDKRT